MTVNAGTLRAYDITAAAATAGEGQAPDQRRIYNFGDRIIKLNPNAQKFLTFLMALRKEPTDDPVFRYLLDRRATAWTGRDFFIGASVNGGSTVVEGTSYAFTVTDAATPAASIDWLKNGDTFNVVTAYDTTGFAVVMVQVIGAVTDAGTTSTFTGKIIQITAAGATNGGIIADDDRCQYISNAFDEDAGAPDSISETLGDAFGNCQYIKHSFEMSEIAIETKYKGYANELNPLWELTMTEHKAALARTMLMGTAKATVNNIRYSDSLIGALLENGTWVTNTDNLSYSSGTPYLRTMAASEAIYDRFVTDFQVLFDPARGSSEEKIGLCGMDVWTYFNRFVAGSGYLDQSINGTEVQLTRPIPMTPNEAVLGIKVNTVDTGNGTMHLVREAILRGPYRQWLVLADMNNLSYRPLVGNGLNLDTRVRANVQAPDEPIRKFVMETVAGLEIGMLESHAGYVIEGL